MIKKTHINKGQTQSNVREIKQACLVIKIIPANVAPSRCQLFLVIQKEKHFLSQQLKKRSDPAVNLNNLNITVISLSDRNNSSQTSAYQP